MPYIRDLTVLSFTDGCQNTHLSQTKQTIFKPLPEPKLTQMFVAMQ